MYRCNACGSVFDDYVMDVERIGELWGEPVDEQYPVCPVCFDENFDEVEECVACGDIVLKDKLEEGICPNCQAAVVRELDVLIHENFNYAERAYLKEVVGL